MGMPQVLGSLRSRRRSFLHTGTLLDLCGLFSSSTRLRLCVRFGTLPFLISRAEANPLGSHTIQIFMILPLLRGRYLQRYSPLDRKKAIRVPL
ncbi:hypothetical protein BDV36DRAFT_244074 [Aspergillus pseudocaelatus]|uniref:Uncharacterized protein n=1 Tax=Aspergillus pseudocaelatus TaxID=1825620 RepID=A0ABQ6X1J5_9EURO|nr:hypothetical protein BDV36DRAFT_244074 [Aspergillus pseudocaelatus]